METPLIILTYFLIYSFLGWCIESVYKSILEKRLINSGFLFGPICPIYGFGAIIMYIFLEDISNKPFFTFCIGFVVLSIWEYAVGFFLEKVFYTKYWDYSNYKFNLQGRVCLINSIFWGILGMLFIDVINPVVTSMLYRVDVDLIQYIDIMVYIILFADIIISMINHFSITEKLKDVEELNISIKEKLDEIKSKGISTEIGESLQEALEDLKTKRDTVVQNSYQRILRLKRAFPTLKSEQISNFLSNREKKGE